MNYYIITGTSQGLGEAIAKKMISSDNYLFCISRKRNEDIMTEAESAKCQIEYFEYDLDYVEGIDELVKRIFNNIDKSKAQSVSLINNAGILNPIKTMEKCESIEIIKNMRINAIAPMILNSQFIKLTEEFECKRSIINISSGAGRKPYYGWACYCSSKSAIDMFTECIGVEQTNKNNPVKVISFAPGVINTDMQKQIRESKVEDFEQVERFKKFLEDGVLKDPSFVAQKVVELLERDDIKSRTIIDIKEL